MDDFNDNEILTMLDNSETSINNAVQEGLLTRKRADEVLSILRRNSAPIETEDVLDPKVTPQTKPQLSEPTAITYNVRLLVLSSLFVFLVTVAVVGIVSNPSYE